SLHRVVAVALTRSEWLTLLLFLLALTFNAILLNEDVQRAFGLCGEGPVQTPCEEE
mgnify:CR=1